MKKEKNTLNNLTIAGFSLVFLFIILAGLEFNSLRNKINIMRIQQLEIQINLEEINLLFGREELPPFKGYNMTEYKKWGALLDYLNIEWEIKPSTEGWSKK